MSSRPAPFLKQLVAEAAAPYRAAGLSAWFFARGKLGGDPVFAHLLAAGLLSERRRILDIGCGQGLLSAWLLAAQTSSNKGTWPESWPSAPQPDHVQGIELMACDVARADSALASAVSDSRASFVQANMCEAEFGAVDAVVILDVLHYVPVGAQDAVLARVRRSLTPGGVLLLRVGDAAGGLRFAISNWVDHVVTGVRSHRLGTLYCRPLAAWQDTLSRLGFVVEAQSMSGGTPFANVLLVARLQPDS